MIIWEPLRVVIHPLNQWFAEHYIRPCCVIARLLMGMISADWLSSVEGFGASSSSSSSHPALHNYAGTIHVVLSHRFISL